MPHTTENVVIVAHKYLTQPDDELVEYLKHKRYKNILHILHSFSDSPDRQSYYSLYKDGKIYKKYRTKDYKKYNELFIYIKETYFTAKWILQSKTKWDLYIGMDGLCVIWGNLLRSLGKINKTVYWAIDFVPKNRFKESIKNNIYHWVNIQGYKNSDEMWDLSPRMAKARQKFLGIKESVYKKRIIVPYGVWLDRIKKYSYDECEKNTLVFMGHLLEKQGAQLVIQAIADIAKKIPDFKFKIIGEGNYKNELEKTAKKFKVEKYCEFKGKIEDHKILENEIARSCLAIAPYIKKLDTWTYYADPGKVKTYLACGVPVLLTDIPWNAKDIQRHKCGQIIEEDINNITKNVLRFMKPAINSLYRINAVSYARSFDYKSIFSALNL